MSNSSSGVFDSNQTHDYFFVISERIYLTVQCAFWIRFREFWAPATAATSGGGATSTSTTTPSGGGSTSGSGGSSTPTSSSGGSSTPTSGPSSASSSDNTSLAITMGACPFHAGHAHFESIAAHQHGISHTHSVSIGSHDHTVSIPSHDHSTPNHSHPAHDHSVPDHTHGLTYGIFKEPMPSSINVNAGLWRKPFIGGSWTLVASISGLTQEENYVDVTSEFIDDPSGLWRLTFQSAPGQPQGGRLTVDVVHDAWGAIQST